MIESLAPHVDLPAIALLIQWNPTRGCEFCLISVKRASGGRFKLWCALYDRSRPAKQWLSIMPPVRGRRQARVRFQSRLVGTGPIKTEGPSCLCGPLLVASEKPLLSTSDHLRARRRRFKQPKWFVFSAVQSPELNLGVWGFLKWFLPWMCAGKSPYPGRSEGSHHSPVHFPPHFMDFITPRVWVRVMGVKVEEFLPLPAFSAGVGATDVRKTPCILFLFLPYFFDVFSLLLRVYSCASLLADFLSFLVNEEYKNGGRNAYSQPSTESVFFCTKVSACQWILERTSF